MKKVVCFLQNAWSPVYAGGLWPRRSWLKALHRSRTGQRIRVLIRACPAIDFHWDNTTPIVGETPDSVIEPDLAHIRRVIRSQVPEYVVGLGSQAGKVLREVVQGPLLLLPHPTYRVVTNALYERAGNILNEGFAGVVQLHQKKGSVALLAL